MPTDAQTPPSTLPLLDVPFAFSQVQLLSSQQFRDEAGTSGISASLSMIWSSSTASGYSSRSIEQTMTAKPSLFQLPTKTTPARSHYTHAKA